MFIGLFNKASKDVFLQDVFLQEVLSNQTHSGISLYVTFIGQFTLSIFHDP